jgi:hypothetical protein
MGESRFRTRISLDAIVTTRFNVTCALETHGDKRSTGRISMLHFTKRISMFG